MQGRISPAWDSQPCRRAAAGLGTVCCVGCRMSPYIWQVWAAKWLPAGHVVLCCWPCSAVWVPLLFTRGAGRGPGWQVSSEIREGKKKANKGFSHPSVEVLVMFHGGHVGLALCFSVHMGPPP